MRGRFFDELAGLFLIIYREELSDAFDCFVFSACIGGHELEIAYMSSAMKLGVLGTDIIR